MTTLLLVLSSAGIGWVAWEMTLLLMDRFAQFQRSARLKNLMGIGGRKTLPFQTFLSFLEGNL